MPFVGAPAEFDHWGGVIVAWFWLNIPLALVFFGCWAGIPLWLTLTRWHAETSARHAEIAAIHAEIAASAVPVPVLAQPALAIAHETGSPVYAGAVDQPGR